MYAIRANPADVGEYLACMGLLAVARRFWHGGASGRWVMRNGDSKFEIRPRVRGADGWPVEQVVKTFLEAGPLVCEPTPLAVVRWPLYDLGQMRLDWWFEPSPWKMWSGRQVIGGTLEYYRQILLQAALPLSDLLTAEVTDRYGPKPYETVDGLGFEFRSVTSRVPDSRRRIGLELFAAIGCQWVQIPTRVRDDKHEFTYRVSRSWRTIRDHGRFATCKVREGDWAYTGSFLGHGDGRTVGPWGRAATVGEGGRPARPRPASSSGLRELFKGRLETLGLTPHGLATLTGLCRKKMSRYFGPEPRVPDVEFSQAVLIGRVLGVRLTPEVVHDWPLSTVSLDRTGKPLVSRGRPFGS